METHRYICDVLKEFRTAIKVGRIDMLPGLIEELQTMGNRMEAKLYEYSDMGYDLERGREFLKEVKALRKKAELIERALDDED